MSGVVHTGYKSLKIGLVEWPWLQLICCAICLLHGHNFWWKEEVQEKSECWLVYIICKLIHLKITSPRWYHLWIIQACLPQWLPFSQHILWQCYNPPGILSSMMGILLFNSVFHDRVTPVSVSTLKSPLRVIRALPLKLWISPILPVCI